MDLQKVELEQEELEQLELSLPKEKALLGSPFLYFYQNFWCPSFILRGVISFRAHFQAQDTDILVITKPKTGTTWLKALAFTILNRKSYPTKETNLSNGHPLATTNPHDLVPFLELTIYNKPHLPDLSKFPHPRLFSTHIPYDSLPESIKSSRCRIIYLCRNPLDTVVSQWKYSRRIREKLTKKGGGEEEVKLEDVSESVCRGVEEFGPYWDHVLGYMRESLKRPDKVLFMKFEDIKEDERSNIKALADFMGCPITLEEEESGVIEEISHLCSIGHLKELEVNKSRKETKKLLTNSFFFRKGEVGDWVNYMTPAMAESISDVMQEKLHSSGLTFRSS